MALTKEEVFKGVVQIITEETGKPATELTLDRTFTDNPDMPGLSLDIDSISVITILTNAEAHFDVTIPDEVQSTLLTIGDVVNFIAGAQD